MKSNALNSLLNTQAGLAALILRVPVGIILAAHGAQKLFGWFSGYGLEGTGQWMASIGLEPGYWMALLAGSAEFFGGVALVLGVFTRLAAVSAVITMLVAIVTVHLSQGFFMSNNGYEYALALMAASGALLVQGAGSWSLDYWLADRLQRRQA
ncbi:MAG: DoxX family protein [Gammaproteobacteria bacterium]|nr:DoxX family protein [Gammaproteobacteria bacterium]